MHAPFSIVPRGTEYVVLDFDGTIAETSHIWVHLNTMLFKRLQIHDSAEEFDKVARNLTLSQCSAMILTRNPGL